MVFTAATSRTVMRRHENMLIFHLATSAITNLLTGDLLQVTSLPDEGHNHVRTGARLSTFSSFSRNPCLLLLWRPLFSADLAHSVA